MNLVIGFGPSLGLALWPRAKPINYTESELLPRESIFNQTSYHVNTIFHSSYFCEKLQDTIKQQFYSFGKIRKTLSCRGAFKNSIILEEDPRIP